MSSIGTLSVDSRGSVVAGAACAAGTAGVWMRVGRRAPIPLPSALRGCSGLFMVEDLFGEFDVAFRPLGSGVISQNRFAETRRLGQPHASRNDSAKDFIFEEVP